MTAKNNLENSLEIKRFLNAPRERVFAAWTRPEERMKWFGNEHSTCLSVTADVQVGGQWRIRMKSDRAGETEFYGVYLAVKFLELDGGTEIHLRHEGFANVELRNRHMEGWGGCIEKLAKWLYEPAEVCQS